MTTRDAPDFVLPLAPSRKHELGFATFSEESLYLAVVALRHGCASPGATILATTISVAAFLFDRCSSVFLAVKKKTNDQAVRVKNVLPQMQAPVRMKLKTSKNLLPAYCILGGL